MKMDYQAHKFQNDIRLVHKQVNNTRVIHCGYAIDIGSRDENKFQLGIAHFWEHMAFKGTQKRKAYHIISRLDSVGGELNAFTTKEKVFFYASVLSEHFEMAAELLTDIAFYSIFPEKQIEKERVVILDEMAMYLDNPDDAIQDDFDQVVFGDHPLGHNILGTTDTLNSIRKKDFMTFINDSLSNEKIVFSVVGPKSFKETLRISNKYIQRIPDHFSRKVRLKPSPNLGQKRNEEKSFGRAYCAIGKEAYSVKDKDRIPFFMLTNILGGPAMNSRLNLSLREKHGYVYSVEASYTSYSDTGLFGIYFGTEKRYLNRSIKIVLTELRKLRQQKLGSLQLHRAKQQIKGQLAISEENNTNLMLMMGRSLIDLDRIDPLDSVFKEVDHQTSGSLARIAEEILIEDQLNYLIFNPVENENYK
jgi:predicted Zn-dependent peptidase